MGRPPCCDKMGVKKGPWTPEEDIMLVSYVQEHGPSNWRAVPTNTGLRRCSKSCRLRWTNYLRPGIKRGSFTDHEEKMIIQLQALLGNKWAAIASYLPERTDNDIKNYWNTHLKKKLKRQAQTREGFSTSASSHCNISRGQWEKRLQTDINTAKQALHDALSIENSKNTNIINNNNNNNTNDDDDHKGCNHITAPSIYASSTENIARLLKDWIKNPNNINNPIKSDNNYQQSKSTSSITDQHSFNNNGLSTTDSTSSTIPSGESKGGGQGIDLSEAFESLFGFESFEYSSNNSDLSQAESKPDLSSQVGSLSMLENWLFDEGGHQGKEDLVNFSFSEHGNLF